MHNYKEKLISDASFFTILKEKNKKIIFTNGCFDCLHAGHLHLLTAAKQLGDSLVVGLNSDVSVRRLKGASRPIETQAIRIQKLAQVVAVDYIIVFEEDTPLELLQVIQPDVLVKGADYLLEAVIGKEYAKETVLIPLLDGYSTTQLIIGKN